MILDAISHGPLVRAGRGQIIAAFENSAYLVVGDDLICLLPAHGPDGAIHARLSHWQSFQRGQSVWLALRRERVWRPNDWPVVSSALARARLQRYGENSLGDPFELLGRGEGLTPAGDDRIAGWLIARHALGMSVDANALLKSAQTQTHVISLGHLRAAALGLGTAPFHQVLNELLDGDIDEPKLAPLDLIGHTSGRDAFGGAMAALTEFAGR